MTGYAFPAGTRAGRAERAEDEGRIRGCVHHSLTILGVDTWDPLTKARAEAIYQDLGRIADGPAIADAYIVVYGQP
jgi:hypothetical protein